jgi:hypothetical protein
LFSHSSSSISNSSSIIGGGGGDDFDSLVLIGSLDIISLDIP